MKTPQLIERLKHNWTIKVMCFVVAFFIYLFYNISTLDTKTLSIPLEIKQEGEVLLTSLPTHFVRVTVRGKPEDIVQISEPVEFQGLRLNVIKVPIPIRKVENQAFIISTIYGSYRLNLYCGIECPDLRHIIYGDQQIPFNPLLRSKFICSPGSTIEKLLKCSFHLLKNVRILNSRTIAIDDHCKVQLLRESI